MIYRMHLKLRLSPVMCIIYMRRGFQSLSQIKTVKEKAKQIQDFIF